MKIYKTELFPYIEGDQIFNSPAKEVTLTITYVDGEVMKDHKGKDTQKYVMHFSETKKGLVLNKTNVKEIISYVGSDETNDWRGWQVTLHTEHIKAFGEMHHAIRVKDMYRPTPEEAQAQMEEDLSDLNQLVFGDDAQ